MKISKAGCSLPAVTSRRKPGLASSRAGLTPRPHPVPAAEPEGPTPAPPGGAFGIRARMLLARR